MFVMEHFSLTMHQGFSYATQGAVEGARVHQDPGFHSLIGTYCAARRRSQYLIIPTILFVFPTKKDGFILIFSLSLSLAAGPRMVCVRGARWW